MILPYNVAAIVVSNDLLDSCERAITSTATYGCPRLFTTCSYSLLVPNMPYMPPATLDQLLPAICGRCFCNTHTTPTVHLEIPRSIHPGRFRRPRRSLDGHFVLSSESPVQVYCKDRIME